MKKRFFIALAIVLSLVMTLGAVSIFTRQVSDPETKKVFSYIHLQSSNYCVTAF